MEGQKALQAMKAEAAEGLEHLRQQAKVMGETDRASSDREVTLLKGHLEEMRQEAEHRHEVLLELLQQKRLAQAALSARDQVLEDRLTDVALQRETRDEDRLDATVEHGRTRQAAAEDAAAANQEPPA